MLNTSHLSFLLCLFYLLVLSKDSIRLDKYEEANDEAGRNFLKKHKMSELTLEPVLIIPGLDGSVLEAKLENAKPPGLCSKNADWHIIWVNLNDFVVPGLLQCFLSNTALNFDESSNTFSNAQGVSIRPRDYGGVGGIKWMVPNLKQGKYFADFIASFEAVGYVVGQNLFAAPYDWRYAGIQDGWNTDTINLIESIYESNQNTPVNLIAHSLGNMQMDQCLATVSAEWKQKYIGKFISVAAPWSGASEALRALVSGELPSSLSSVAITASSLKLRPTERTWASLSWLVPDKYFPQNLPLVVTPSRNYTVNDIGTLFESLDSTLSKVYQATLNNPIITLGVTDVQLYCAYGTGSQTELWYDYTDGNFDKDPVIHYDLLGDGTVPDYSLKRCLELQPIQAVEFDLRSHIGIISDPDFIEYALGLVTSSSSSSKNGVFSEKLVKVPARQQ